MNKGNIHRKINNPKYGQPEKQRAKEQEYYQSLQEQAAHKPKADRKPRTHSDHKHSYEPVEIVVVDVTGTEIHLLGKACAVCGKLHSKTDRKCTMALFSKDPHDEIPPDVKQYRYLGQGKITETQEGST